MFKKGTLVKLNPNISKTIHCNEDIEYYLRKYNLIGEIIRKPSNKIGVNINFYSRNKEFLYKEWKNNDRISNITQNNLMSICKNYYIGKKIEILPVKNKIKKL